MILQFGTIIFSFIISKSIFFSKKENLNKKSTKSYDSKPPPNLKEKYNFNSNIESKNQKPETIKSYSQIRDKFLVEVSNMVSKEKEDLIEHIDHNFKDFKEELQSQNADDRFMAYQKVIDRFANSLSKFENKRLSGDVNYVTSFRNYNTLHNLILKILISSKTEFESKNNTIDLNKLKENICINYSQENGTYKL